jgi:hypothetical protein
MKNKILFTSDNIIWQWDNNPISILNAIRFWSEDRGLALNKLKEGQANNKNVQRLYEVAAANSPDFWDLVFYITQSRADWAAFEKSLAWQQWHEWTSLSKSVKAWEAKPRQELWAYFHLLWGMKKDPGALKNYRACWKEDKERVMSMVADAAKI